MERTVVGVDLAAGRGVTAMAALRLSDGDSLASLSLLSLSYPADDEAILALAAALAPAVIGLDAPLTLPAPVADATRGAEPQAQASPFTRAAERDPIWSRLGVRPFPVSFLGGLTFRAIPLAARLRVHAPASQVIEIFPSAALAILGLRTPVSRGQPRRAKTSPAQRRATQSALSSFIAGMPDSDADAQPLGADALDAIAAALSAAAYALDAAKAVGDLSEGCIILPARCAAELFMRADVSDANATPHTPETLPTHYRQQL